MKYVFIIIILCSSIAHAVDSKKPKKEKDETRKEKKEDVNSMTNKNLHSLKKWKLTIEYTNGNIVSKTISVDKNSTTSALDAAFEEADKYLKNSKKIKDYTIAPVTNNYVVLAGK